MKRGEDVGNPWQEAVIVSHHANELLQGLDGLGRRESLDGIDFVLGGRDTVAGEGVAKELHLGLGE